VGGRAAPGAPRVFRAIVTLAITSGPVSRGAVTSVLGFASQYSRYHYWLLRRGLDHRHDAGADGLGQPIPGVDDGGQIRIGG
jgi:hypothetical protein